MVISKSLCRFSSESAIRTVSSAYLMLFMFFFLFISTLVNYNGTPKGDEVFQLHKFIPRSIIKLEKCTFIPLLNHSYTVITDYSIKSKPCPTF